MLISRSVGITVFALSMLYVSNCAIIPTNIDTLVDYSKSTQDELLNRMDYHMKIYDSFVTFHDSMTDFEDQNCTMMVNNMTGQINSTVKLVNAFDKDMAKCTESKKTAYNTSWMALSSAKSDVSTMMNANGESAYFAIMDGTPLVMSITDPFFDQCLPTKRTPTAQEIKKSTKCIDDLKLSTVKIIDSMSKEKTAKLFELLNANLMGIRNQIWSNLNMNLNKMMTTFLTDVSKCVEKVGKNKMAAKVKPTKEWNAKYSKLTASLKKSMAAVKMV